MPLRVIRLFHIHSLVVCGVPPISEFVSMLMQINLHRIIRILRLFKFVYTYFLSVSLTAPGAAMSSVKY